MPIMPPFRAVAAYAATEARYAQIAANQVLKLIEDGASHQDQVRAAKEAVQQARVAARYANVAQEAIGLADPDDAAISFIYLMGTRATIGLADTNGAIEFIYLHQDGSPSGAGDILHRHYDDDATRRLIALGMVDASKELHGKMGERDGYPASVSLFPAEAEIRLHTTCTARYRALDTGDFLAQSRLLWADFIYLRQNGIWLAALHGKNGISALSPLAETYLDPQRSSEALPMISSDSRIVALDVALAGYIEARLSGSARYRQTALYAFYDLLDATLATATPDDLKMIESRYPY